MKNLRFKPLAFAVLTLISFVLASITFGASPAILGLSAAVAFVTGTALSLSDTSNTLGGIQVEIWENTIEKELFKGNEFLNLSHSADDNVINGIAVHIPQSGGSGNVVKNRTTFPATIRKRTDTDVIYLIDEYTSDPVKIPDADTHELSYDKRQSVLEEDLDNLKEVMAEWMIQNWLKSPASLGYSASQIPAENILETTGAAVPASAPGATGNRKAARLNDLQRLQTYLRTKKRWIEGKMHVLLPPGMMAELFPAESQITATYMQATTEKERRMGVIAKAQGFKIHTRSTVATLTDAGALNAPGAAGATTDDEAALVWYEQAVERATGTIKMFQNEGNPVHYADIYSMLVRMGGRARRSDYAGIALLKQANAI
jgi:hypothetical protein